MGKRRESPRVTAQHRRRQDRLRVLVSREKTQKAFADKHGLNPKHLSQMLSTLGSPGWRGIGDDTVEKIEGILALPKNYFDAPEVSEPLSAELAESRPKNNLKAIRFAVQSLFSVLAAKNKDMADAVAQDIVETAGTEFAGHGFLGALVRILRGVPEMSEADVKRLQQAPVSRASKRAVSAAK